ncbi:hypothetical protein I203_108013 [Kwoniella mangroviensis CBS 8507]|uniref:hypothetical protein n=1 Tax=Kwoniella mangroviensis CBS 8507 TaxID=1296122 RepID=UPI00306DD114
MGGFGSKPTLPINALHFRVYSFQNQYTYQRCLDYANTMSALVEQAAVTRLTDDLTFIACYRVNPCKKKDIKLVQEEIKSFVGPQYSMFVTLYSLVISTLAEYLNLNDLNKASTIVEVELMEIAREGQRSLGVEESEKAEKIQVSYQEVN